MNQETVDTNMFKDLYMKEVCDKMTPKKILVASKKDVKNLVRLFITTVGQVGQCFTLYNIHRSQREYSRNCLYTSTWFRTQMKKIFPCIHAPRCLEISCP